MIAALACTFMFASLDQKAGHRKYEKIINSLQTTPINPLNSVNFLGELTKFIGLTDIF